jgi:CDGSH-type Zn-finger protein
MEEWKGPASEPLVVRCRENGPYVIQGAVKVLDHLGNEFVIPPGKDTVALCRCGRSAKKPFCDGSHRQCGFLAPELAPTGTGITNDQGPMTKE